MSGRSVPLGRFGIAISVVQEAILYIAQNKSMLLMEIRCSEIGPLYLWGYGAPLKEMADPPRPERPTETLMGGQLLTIHG